MNILQAHMKGAYIVKQIDGFSELSDGREGMHVGVALTQVFQTENQLKSLTGDQVRDLLGTRAAPIKIHVPVGEMALFEVGQIVIDGAYRGKLPYETRTIRCANPRATGPLAENGVMNTPPGWRNRQVLRSKELAIGEWDRSNYLVFQHKGTEYVIPSTLIFRTFYCPGSAFANEISGSSWNEVKRKFVADSAVSEEDGRKVWSLKLAPGAAGTKAMLHQLALFTFSPHATRCINAIHTRRLLNKNAAEWNVLAEIPHDTSDLGMTVEGYSLTQYPGRIPRFLVTRIVKCEWTAGDVVIQELVDQTDPDGETADHEGVTPGFPRPQRVEGNPEASFGAPSNPDPTSNINVFRFGIEYVNAPQILNKTDQQIACKPGPKGSVRPNRNDVAVSGGVPSGSAGSPAGADVVPEHRDASPHFEYVGGSLKRLQEAKKLTFERLGPAPSSNLYTRRFGGAAWSLAGPGTGGEPPPSKQVRKMCPWAWVWDHDKPKTKYARALLAYSIVLDDWQCVILEIEKRTTSKEAFRFFVLKDVAFLPDEQLEPVLENLRNSEGVARAPNVTFQSLLRANPFGEVHGFDHRAAAPLGQDQKSRPLDDNYLFQSLLKLKQAST